MLKRVMIVIGLLVIYRMLAHIPVPLGEPTTFQEAIKNLLEKSDFGNFLNLISGGGFTAFSILLSKSLKNVFAVLILDCSASSVAKFCLNLHYV